MPPGKTMVLRSAGNGVWTSLQDALSSENLNLRPPLHVSAPSGSEDPAPRSLAFTHLTTASQTLTINQASPAAHGRQSGLHAVSSKPSSACSHVPLEAAL